MPSIPPTPPGSPFTFEIPAKTLWAPPLQMPGSSYLYSRCAVKSFKENAKPLVDILGEESRDILQTIGVLPFFYMPDIQQNIPLLYHIIRCYCPRRNAFLLGKVYVKLTTNQVAQIIGLPNRGKEFNFERTPLSNFMHKDLVQELSNLAFEESSPSLELRRVNALIKYVLAVLFFPLKGLKVPACIMNLHGLEDFGEINWPQAIHKFLHTHFAPMSQIATTEGMNLGYLEGCSFVLVVWFFEHTSIAMATSELATPRFNRWSSKLTVSAKQCAKLHAKLSRLDAVRSAFVYISVEEQELFGEVGEEESSDFEGDRRSEEQKKKAREERREKEEKKSVREERRERKERKEGKEEKRKENEGKGKERKEERRDEKRSEEKMRKERRREEKEMMERKREERIRGYVDEAVGQLKNFIQEKFDALAALIGGNRPLEGNEKEEKENEEKEKEVKEKAECTAIVSFRTCSDIVHTEGRVFTPKKAIKKRRVKTDSCLDERYQYPGRDDLAPLDREIIDFVLGRYPDGDSIVIERGNIYIPRSSITEILGEGWVCGSQIDAYAYVLDSLRENNQNSMINFMFVSSNHAYYKSCGKKCSRLVEHITPQSLAASDVIVMPCNVGFHWVLLVANLKERHWDFYDSLPNPMHRSSLRTHIGYLQEDRAEVLPEDIVGWPINLVEGIPVQANGNDCGIFVMQFMKACLQKEQIPWSSHSRWPKDMPRIRGEVVAELFRAFHTSLLVETGYLI